MSSTDPWRLDPSITFLNHGSYGACPTPVLEALDRWRDRLEANPVALLTRDLEGELDRARREIGRFLNADPDGLAFVPNATTGVNTVLRSLRFQSGDELLTNDHEYNATLNALAEIAARDGAKVVLAHIPFPIADPDQAVKAILDAATPRTRLALISHVTSPTALVLPIERLVRELDVRGIDTLVDGAHAPGMVPIDLEMLGAAYWTGNGHKWLCGPKGSAVIWVRADRRDRIRPLVISHGANDPRSDRSRFRLEFDWTGTTDPTPYLALAEAIGIVGAMEPRGWPSIMAANRELALAGRDRLTAALGIEPPAPNSMIGSMAALPLPLPGHDEAAERLQGLLLERHRIEVPISAWPVRAARGETGATRALIRISAQRYNRIEDYDRLGEALRSTLGSAVASTTRLAAE